MVKEKQVMGRDLKAHLDTLEATAETVLAIVPVMFIPNERGALIAQLFMVYSATRIVIPT